MVEVELKRKITLKQKGKEPEKGNSQWGLWLILVLVVAGGIIYLLTKEDRTPISTKNTVVQSNILTDETTVTASAGEETLTANETEKTVKPTDATTPPPETKPVITPLPYKQGEAYKVYQFPFGTGEYSQPDPELNNLSKVLAENQDVKIQIFAYTDNVGSAKYNQWLSEKRAKAIYDYLVSKGVGKSQLSYQGKGISIKYSNNAENRRAEFILK